MSETRTAPAPTADLAHSSSSVTRKWSAEPSGFEVLLVALASSVIFVTVVSLLGKYFFLVQNSADNATYIATASAIRHWNFGGLVVRQFWGLPYIMSLVSLLTGVSDHAALLLVSSLASLVSVALAYRLWGGWVASFFAILNFDWIQRSFLGGAEPLFVAFLLAAFWAVRRDNWLLASFLASLSTIVRPMGLFALAAVGLSLLWQRKFQKLVLTTLIGLIVGGLYVLPMALYFGNPLANVSTYQRTDWRGGLPITWPFFAIIEGTTLHDIPWTNLARTFGWIFVVLIAAIRMMTSSRFREYGRSHPVEGMFAGTYLIFIYTYNSPAWARAEFTRFVIPIVPFVLLALYRWLPKHRLVVWTLTMVFSILAGATAVGLLNTIKILRRAMG
jgi:hypothetical protein